MATFSSLLLVSYTITCAFAGDLSAKCDNGVCLADGGGESGDAEEASEMSVNLLQTQYSVVAKKSSDHIVHTASEGKIEVTLEYDIKQNASEQVGEKSSGRRRKERTAVKQCLKNKAGISFTLKAFNSEGEKKYQDNNFLYGEEYCHKSDSAGNFRTFEVQSNACDVARVFAQVGAGAAVVGAITAGAVLSGGATLGAQIAGNAIMGIVGITTPAAKHAITSIPNGELDGLILIPGNMKEGAGRLKLTGNCVAGIEVENR